MLGGWIGDAIVFQISTNGELVFLAVYCVCIDCVSILLLILNVWMFRVGSLLMICVS